MAETINTSGEIAATLKKMTFEEYAEKYWYEEGYLAHQNPIDPDIKVLQKNIENPASTSSIDYIVLIKWVQRIEKKEFTERGELYIYYIDENGCSCIKKISRNFWSFRNIRIFTE